MDIDSMTTHEILTAFQERIAQTSGLEFCPAADITQLIDTLTNHLALRTWETVQA